MQRVTHPPAHRTWVIFSPHLRPLSTVDPWAQVSHLWEGRWITRKKGSPSKFCEREDTRLVRFWPIISSAVPEGIICVRGGVNLWSRALILFQMFGNWPLYARLFRKLHQFRGHLVWVSKMSHICPSLHWTPLVARHCRSGKIGGPWGSGHRWYF